jgi:hypothetical protein
MTGASWGPHPRRRFLRLAACTAVLPAVSRVVWAQAYPRERQTPEALNALRKADAEKWWPIIKELGIKPE